MAREKRTQSERLFEEICDEHNIAYRELPRLQHKKQPDYELDLNGQGVVVEVKQVNPNEEDKVFAEVFEHEGQACQVRDPDDVAERVRNHIKNSRRQIDAYLERHPNTPALLVLFDKANNMYTDPNTIHTAMYGWEQVVLEAPSNGTAPTVVDRGFGPRNNSEIRPDKNLHLSALVTLHESWDRDTQDRFLALCFYHNHFAADPFSPSWWHGEHVVHMALSRKLHGEYQDWIRLSPESGPQHPAGGGGDV